APRERHMSALEQSAAGPELQRLALDMLQDDMLPDNRRQQRRPCCRPRPRCRHCCVLPCSRDGSYDADDDDWSGAVRIWSTALVVALGLTLTLAVTQWRRRELDDDSLHTL